MLFKNLLSVVGCLLGAAGVLADEQYTNENTNIPRAITSDYADQLRDSTPDFIAVRLYSEANQTGNQCTIDKRYLEHGACLNLPKDARVKSITKSGLACCLLYRSPCPINHRSEWHTQTDGFFHQKIFGTVIDDLTPYGFTDNPLSIVCPKKDICDAFKLDRNWSPEEMINVAQWWIDYRTIPGRKYI